MSGPVKKRTVLRYVVRSQTPRGRYLGTDCFDVPSQDWAAGTITGLEAMAELLAALQAGAPLADVDARTILIHAARKAQAEPADARGPSARHAAFQFIQVAARLLEYVAAHTNWRNYIDAEMERCRRDALCVERWEARRRAHFVNRMRAGKVAKRAAQQVLATMRASTSFQHGAEHHG